MKQKKLVSAIRRIVGAELLLTAALSSLAHAQVAAVPAGASGAASTNTESGVNAAPATSTPAAAVSKLQRVEVTGSLIKSSDKVGFNQVQTVTAKEIQDSGATTVTDFLRDSAVNSASSWGSNNANSFAPGASGIALRGMSEKYTLVLVDGVRVAPYGFAVNGTDSFFDLDSIPLNMVERIEIVKTGAVSQYGSDAVAGVVNIITKKNFKGLELDGSVGVTGHGDGNTKKFSILAGFGDLNADRFNVTAALSYFQQGGIMASDRSMTAGQDFSSYPGGRLNYSTGDFLYPTANTDYTAFGCAPGTVLKNRADLSSGGTGTSCAYNSANGNSIQPESERMAAKIDATFKINDSMQAFADIWDSRNTTRLEQGYSTLSSGSSYYDPSTQTIQSLSNTLAAGNRFNPLGTDVGLHYAFLGSPETVDTVSNFFRAATGVKGSFTLPHLGDWDWAATLSHSQSSVSVTTNNLLSVSGVENALSSAGTFDFANPTNYDGIYANDQNQAISKLDTLDLTASTANLFMLPAGPVGFGVGTQFLHQSQYIGSGYGSINGLNSPPLIQDVDGERNVVAAYYQFDIPLIRTLTLSQSTRFDHYSDFGDAVSPRVALRWQPIQQFTSFASYTRGFRAPTLVENANSSTASAQIAVDSRDPENPGSEQLITEFSKGNPNLAPERTKNIDVGFQLSPADRMDIGFDYYHIQVDNLIGSGNLQDIVDANDPTLVHRNAAGTITSVDVGYANVGTLKTDGFEINFHKSLPTPYGTFSLLADWAYVWHFTVDEDGTSTNYAGNNGAIEQPFGAAFPRWHSTTSLAWNYRKFNTTLTWDFTGPYSQAVGDTDSYPGESGKVASYSQFDLYTTYNGFKNWTIYGGINNLFNRAPPFDPLWMDYSITGYDTSLYSDVGRYFQVGATYHF